MPQALVVRKIRDRIVLSTPGKYRWWESAEHSIEYDEGIDWPKISIVTPSYGQGEYIEDTILSVLHQNYPSLEYFVMDGGSSDGTVEVLERYADRLAGWLSEKDSGQSNAINKGLARSTGQLFNWLNSDDLLAPGALKAIALKFAENDVHCVAGNILLFGTEEGTYDTAIVKGDDDATLKEITIKQPSTFYSMDAVKKMGPLNESLHYIMDYEWFIRFLLNHQVGQIAEVDQVLSYFRFHDESKTGSDIDQFELHKDIFWKQIHGLLEGVEDGPFDIPRDVYDQPRVRNAKSDFFYRRCVVNYGARNADAFAEYAQYVDPKELSESDRNELGTMAKRMKVVPKFMWKWL